VGRIAVFIAVLIGALIVGLIVIIGVASIFPEWSLDRQQIVSWGLIALIVNLLFWTIWIRENILKKK